MRTPHTRTNSAFLEGFICSIEQNTPPGRFRRGIPLKLITAHKSPLNREPGAMLVLDLLLWRTGVGRGLVQDFLHAWVFDHLGERRVGLGREELGVAVVAR